MSSTRTQRELGTATAISSLCSVFHFISVIAFVSHHICFKPNLAQVVTSLPPSVATFALNEMVRR